MGKTFQKVGALLFTEEETTFQGKKAMKTSGFWNEFGDPKVCIRDSTWPAQVTRCSQLVFLSKNELLLMACLLHRVAVRSNIISVKKTS